MNKLGFYGENGFSVQSEERHIAENIKRVLMTRPFQRVGDLSFGSNLRSYLFREEMSISDIFKEIKNSVTLFEPRVEVLDCVLKNFDKVTGVLDIELSIRIKKNNKVIKTDLSI